MTISEESTLYEDIEEALKEVIDPEIGINIVDLGLVYGLDLNNESSELRISMTLTTAECPLQDVISAGVGHALESIVSNHAIAWVWLPAWTPARITDDGKEMMRAIGFNV